MSIESDPEKAVEVLFRAIEATDAAENFLSDEERKLLSEYNLAVDALYPEGIPQEDREEILGTIAKEFQWVDEIISKILNKTDELREERKKSGKQ